MVDILSERKLFINQLTVITVRIYFGASLDRVTYVTVSFKISMHLFMFHWVERRFLLFLSIQLLVIPIGDSIFFLFLLSLFLLKEKGNFKWKESAHSFHCFSIDFSSQVIPRLSMQFLFYASFYDLGLKWFRPFLISIKNDFLWLS